MPGKSLADLIQAGPVALRIEMYDCILEDDHSVDRLS